MFSKLSKLLVPVITIFQPYNPIFAIQNFLRVYEGYEVWRYIGWQTRTDAPYC
jgi:hypothetical protein